jgi:translation initiation factor IF-3
MKKRGNRNDQNKKGPSIVANDRIKEKAVQLISSTGENIGVVDTLDAQHLAQVEGLDLVMIAPNGEQGVPVVKVMDLGKALYEKKKKLSEAKKKQTVIQIKEVKIRPKIGAHDFDTKLRRGVEFLESGKHLKVTLVFRGREMATKTERGLQLFERVEAFFEEAEILDKLVQERDATSGPLWSRIYHVKSK